MLRSTTLALSALALATAAHATPVRFVALGHIEYNQFLPGSTFAGQPGLPANTPCRLQINLDSNNYLNNPTYPVRGYIFGVNDLTIDIGSVRAVPRASETVNYFCIRNNDPAVDGVFISKGTGYDTEIPLAIVPNNYGIAFLYSFNNGTHFTSLDILQCTGSWAYTDIGTYNFGIQRGEGSVPLGIWYDSFSITRQCSAADMGSQGGVAGFDGLLDNNDFIVFIDRFFQLDASADLGSQGGVAGPDGVHDNNDFVVFIDTFFTGC